MRAMWTGTISWGLVSLAIKLGAATGDHSVKFRQIHAEDGGPIRYQRMCSLCGKAVDYAEVGKGFEYANGQVIALTDDDLEALPLATKKTVSVLRFVPADQIDPLSTHSAYYTWPASPAAGRAYVLLRDALRTSKKVAVCMIAIRQRERLAILSVRGSVLMLTTLLWADEVREPDMELPDGKPTPAERKMARALIDAASGDFKPGEFEDGYQAAVETLVAAKAAVADPVPQAVKAAAAGAASMDLTAALEASLAAASHKPPSSPRRKAAK